jgi:hypothetical protein
MSYPTGWRRIGGDPGTATVALIVRHRFLGYLNVTPRQGSETLTGWQRFRVKHNAEEGDRAVVTLASGSGLRFRSGSGSCVRDAYRTTSGTRYVEIACLVAGRLATSVIVGAAPPDQWPRISPLIERAISAFVT